MGVTLHLEAAESAGGKNHALGHAKETWTRQVEKAAEPQKSPAGGMSTRRGEKLRADLGERGFTLDSI
jgi:hypothetical protein